MQATDKGKSPGKLYSKLSEEPSSTPPAAAPSAAVATPPPPVAPAAVASAMTDSGIQHKPSVEVDLSAVRGWWLSPGDLDPGDSFAAFLQ